MGKCVVLNLCAPLVASVRVKKIVQLLLVAFKALARIVSVNVEVFVQHVAMLVKPAPSIRIARMKFNATKTCVHLVRMV